MSKNKKSSKPATQKKEAPAKKNYTSILIFAAVISAAAIIFFCLRKDASESGLLDENKTYYADIAISHPTLTFDSLIIVQLDQKAAPITAANFVHLAEQGFYNGLKFHRIIDGFMMQGGAPNSGQDAADNITGEFALNGWNNPLKHERGVISMARAEDMNSANSQFFIVQETSSHLDGKYAAFGKVIQGMEVVDAICKAAQPTNSNGAIAKEDQPMILAITIRAEE